MKLAAFNLLFLLSGILLGETYTLKVIDHKTKHPIDFVEIYCTQIGYLGTTDANGQFSFTDKQSNRLTLVNPSYAVAELAIATDTLDYLVEMFRNETTLSEVILQEKKQKEFGIQRLKAVEGTSIYAGKKSEVILLDLSLGNKATNNPRQIYAKVSGLNIYDSNDGGLQLNIGGRGLDPNRTANFNTRQNHYDISADVLGYPESYYTPPTEALGKIEIIRGAASLQYGTQFGGLVNFKFKEPSKKVIDFSTTNSVGSFGLYSNFSQLSGTNQKWSYQFITNYKRSDGFRPNSHFESFFGFARLGYAFSEKSSIGLEYTRFNYLAKQPGGLSDKQFRTDPTQSFLNRNWFEVKWNLLALKLQQALSDADNVSLVVSGLYASRKALGLRGIPGAFNPQLFNPKVDQQDEFGEFLYPRDLIIGQFRNLSIEGKWLRKYEISDQRAVFLLGSKYYHGANSSQQGAGSKGIDANFELESKYNLYANQNNFDFPNRNLAVFMENIFHLTNHLTVTPGARFEHITTTSEGNYFINQTQQFEEDNRTLNRNFFLLGLGLSYKPWSSLEVYHNLSQNYRSVTFSDIRTTNPSFIIDPNITDEKGWTADLGLRGKYSTHLSYDIDVFALYYGNRIGQVLNDRAQWIRQNIGTALIYGLESLIEWNLQPLLFENDNNVKLSLFSNLAITQSQYLSSEQPNVEGNQVEFIPRTNLKLGLNTGYKNLIAQLQYSYTSLQFTDVTNSPYNPDNDRNVIGAIPSYDILDLSLSYTLNSHLKLATGINNLLDNSYFTRRATGYPGPGIIPAEPMSWYMSLTYNI